MRHYSHIECERCEDHLKELEEELAACAAALAECQEDRLQRVRALEASLAEMKKVVDVALAWLDADDEDAEVTLVDVLLAHRKTTQKEA